MFYVYEVTINLTSAHLCGQYEDFQLAKSACRSLSIGQEKNNEEVPYFEREHNIFIITTTKFGEGETIPKDKAIY